MIFRESAHHYFLEEHLSRHEKRTPLMPRDSDIRLAAIAVPACSARVLISGLALHMPSGATILASGSQWRSLNCSDAELTWQFSFADFVAWKLRDDT